MNGVRIHHDNFERASTALLGIVCITLSTYWWLHRRQSDRWRGYCPLLVRAAIVFTCSAFFTYCPGTSSLGRTVLLALNADKPESVANLRMFDCVQRADEAIYEEDYTTAISFTHQAMADGCQWLSADSTKDRAKINGVYTSLYQAFRGRGRALREHGHFEAALRSYQFGHRFLMKGDYATQAAVQHSTPWEIAEEARSLDKQAYY